MTAFGRVALDGEEVPAPSNGDDWRLAVVTVVAILAAWLLIFIPATRELSSAIFLVGPNTRVISVMLFDLSEEGNFEVLSALGVILLIATVAIAVRYGDVDRSGQHDRGLGADVGESADSCARLETRFRACPAGAQKHRSGAVDDAR